MPSLSPDPWFAVQVAARSEKRIASVLEYKGYEQFVPTYRCERRHADRFRTLLLPLFPGYVFVRATSRALGGLICSTPGVIRILGAGARHARIPDDEIDAVRKLVDCGDPRPTEYIAVGERVVVREGPLVGVTGVVVGIRNRFCLVVSVDLISRSICVVVDPFQLAPVASEVRTSGIPYDRSWNGLARTYC